MTNSLTDYLDNRSLDRLADSHSLYLEKQATNPANGQFSGRTIQRMSNRANKQSSE